MSSGARRRSRRSEASVMTAWGDMALGSWLWMGIWVVALLAMVWLVVRGRAGRSSEQDAREIRRARFARCEIGKDEFERARDLLLEPRTQLPQTGEQR